MFLIVTLVAFAIPLLVERLGREWLIALLPVYLITGNVFAQSFVAVLPGLKQGGILTSLAIPVYATTFLITDILVELYGESEAKRAIWVGLVGQICFQLMLSAVLLAPILPPFSDGFRATFSVHTRLILGSFTAYIISQALDVAVYGRIRAVTGADRFVWLRNSVATILAQAVDTCIFLAIAFWGVPPLETTSKWVEFAIVTWLVKVVVAVIDTPYLYLARWISHRRIPQVATA